MSTQSVAAYVVDRLARLGITDCFGVPGDYSFPFCDAIAKHPTVRWLGCSNELNAAYAADGYARIRGAAMLSTTYAVGELSALCGLMGARAERSTIFHLVGMPSMRHQRRHKIMHHTFGDGVFQNFIDISARAACAHAVLTPENCTYETERVIAAAVAHRQPAYLIVAEDLALMPVTGPRVEPFPEPASTARELAAALDAAAEKIAAARSGCILPAFTVARFGLQHELAALVEASGLPFATTSMDKAVLSETHPHFLGGYAGTEFSAPHVTAAVEGSDVVIDVGGVLFNDLSTTAFATHIEPAKLLTLGVAVTRIGDRVFTNVRLRDMLVGLTRRVKRFPASAFTNPTPAALVGAPDDRITAASLYPRYERFFRPRDIVVVETGTSAPAVAGLRLPDGAVYHNQTLWGSIGWATGAALGTAVADRSRRTVLITGEGSHQLTANEIGNYGRHGVTPVIFVLNNGGYAIERVLEEYPDWVYNDLAPWNYHALPAALGCADWFTARVQTNGELDAAMGTAAAGDRAAYIEVVCGKHDYPPAMKAIHKRLAELHGA